MPVYSRLMQDYIFSSCKQLCQCTFNLHQKFGANLFQTYKDMTLYPHMYQTCMAICFRKTSVYRNDLYISVSNSRNIVSGSLCLVSFSRRQIVLSRKVWHFVVAYIGRKLWSYLHSYLNSPRIWSGSYSVYLSKRESIDHLCFNPILRIGLIHKWSIDY